MKNKKGWMKTIEALMAVIIILGAVLIFSGRQVEQVDVREQVFDTQQNILEIISKNESLRSKVLINDSDFVNAQVSSLIPNGWNSKIEICELNDVCSYSGNYINSEVYSTEIVISSTLLDYNPKKLRFFIWFD
jgi:hypothetical protein